MHWSSFLSTSWPPAENRSTGIVDFHRCVSTNYEFILPHTGEVPHKWDRADSVSVRFRLPRAPHTHAPDTSDTGTSSGTE